MSLNLDDELLNEAKEITGLPTTATVEEILRRFVTNERQRRALSELSGLGWDGPHHSRPTFETLASEFRALTADRLHTPSEVLMREGRGER
ncbi:type II toxin-antitoxin system VapB family antitoxin [Neorhizobium vignae]|jgi:Arc/MetJ family transcription regulator|uniref:type II toxin-antitoxin system VapB family antitoxin n=1 Tax=Neorhizobium vignae TaxID=690585 RepID=UPI001FCC2117|nr:type II toxin-antitoxin system VapB family antitoxin [Neorhizobium vignae]